MRPSCARAAFVTHGPEALTCVTMVPGSLARLGMAGCPGGREAAVGRAQRGRRQDDLADRRGRGPAPDGSLVTVPTWGGGRVMEA